MLDQYRDRVVVAEIDANEPLKDTVDIALYDSFAQPESDHDEIDVLVQNPRARRVVVYTWNFHPDLIDSARSKGAHGYLSKTLPARDLVAALEAVHAGEIVVSDPPRRTDGPSGAGLARRGRRTHRSRGRDPRPDHPGQEQRRGRRADLPQPQHREVLHPHHLPQDRRRQPHPGRALGRQPRLHPRPPPHRPLAPRAITAFSGRWRARHQQERPAPIRSGERTSWDGTTLRVGVDQRRELHPQSGAPWPPPERALLPVSVPPPRRPPLSGRAMPRSRAAPPLR